MIKFSVLEKLEDCRNSLAPDRVGILTLFFEIRDAQIILHF